MSLSRREFLASMTGLAALLPDFKAQAAPLFSLSRYAITGALITGDGSPPLTEHAILVDNGRIEALKPLAIVADRPIIAIPGTTIVPGVINCHCHRIHSHADRRQRYLEHGVTSIGDTASPLAALNELTQSPPGGTATAACSGPMLCPPGGYPLPVHSPDHALIITSATHGRVQVRQLADRGATMIKLSFEPGPYPEPWPMFDAATASAICDEARKLGMVVRCHVEDLGGLQPALDAGVHTVEHVPHRWITGGERREVLQKVDERLEPIPAYRVLLERMVREKVILTPTLDVLSRSIWNGPELTEPVRFFADRGGLIAVGNDHPYRRTEAGMPIREMELLHAAGLAPAVIIQGGTQISGRACGFTDRGTIAPGMRADLLVVNGDPLTDLTALGTPIHVIKDGIFFK